MGTIRWDFNTGFDISEAPSGEFNVSLDASEVSGAPVASAPGDTAVTGTASTFANSAHVHAREAFATNTIVLGTAAAAGAATTLIRSDATIAAFDITNPTTSAVGDAAAVGTAAFAARRDHTHGREAFATNTIVLGTAAAAGVATTLIRSDATIVAFDTTAPTTSAVGDAAAVGAAAVAARRDHTHGREAFAGTADIANVAATEGAGAAVTVPRGDHTHALGIGTTKGDVLAHDGTVWTRLAVGANNTALIADSTQASGVKWVTPPSGLSWVGGDTTERTTATGTQVDLVTISGLSIAQTSPILVTLSWRKTTGAAVGCSLGLKLNTTEVRTPIGVGVGTNSADSGVIFFWVNAVVAANEGQGLLIKISANGGGSTLNDISTARPAATVTSVIITANSESASVTLAVDEVHAYTLAAS